MKRNHITLLLILIAVCLVIISAVCWHSVEEIHYLKSFYPTQFSVEEAFYANMVELVKIAIICVPFILIIGISLHFLRYIQKNN